MFRIYTFKASNSVKIFLNSLQKKAGLKNTSDRIKTFLADYDIIAKYQLKMNGMQILWGNFK
jgi:hypothetical protein